METLIGLRSQGGVPVTWGSGLNKKCIGIRFLPWEFCNLRLVDLNHDLNIAYALAYFRYNIRLVGLNNYFYDVFSSMKQSDPENSLKAQFVIFRCQKYVKKVYMEMGEQLYLEPLKSVPSYSILHYSYAYYKLNIFTYSFTSFYSLYELRFRNIKYC